MQYALEILPSLLKGASLTLQVFAFVLILSIPLGIVVAFTKPYMKNEQVLVTKKASGIQ